MIQCPRGCVRDYMERMPQLDTDKSIAFLCCACGKLLHLFVRNHGEEKADSVKTEINSNLASESRD